MRSLINQTRLFLLSFLFICVLVSCQGNATNGNTPTDQFIASEEETIEPGTPEPNPSSTATMTATLTQSLEDQGRAYADIAIDDLPECKVSLDMLSYIDLSQFNLQMEDLSEEFLNKDINRLIINDVTDEMGRILILDRGEDGKWTLSYSYEEPYPIYLVSVSPSGKYLVLALQYDINSRKQVAIFDVEQLRIVGTSNEVRIIPELGWSSDESKLIIPLRWGTMDPDPAAGIAEIYEIPSLEHLKTVGWPDDIYWIEYGFWASPDPDYMEKFLFRTAKGVYLYQGESIEVVEEIYTEGYYFNINVDWIDGDKYVASYVEEISFEGEDYWFMKLGTFEETQQLDEYTIFTSGTLGSSTVSHLEYAPYDQEVTLSTYYNNRILRFELSNQILNNPCQVDIRKLLGQLDSSILEKEYVDPIFISDDIFYLENMEDEKITVYQITWEP